MAEASSTQRTPLAGPIRMCVGCRGRAGRSVLLRVVAVEVDGLWSVVPDPSRRHPGRGASLHPELRCLDLAERRRAFTRALRPGVPLASDPVREYLQRRATAGTAPPHQEHPEREPSTESGSDADEHSMSDQR